MEEEAAHCLYSQDHEVRTLQTQNPIQASRDITGPPLAITISCWTLLLLKTLHEKKPQKNSRVEQYWSSYLYLGVNWGEKGKG